MQQEQIHCRAGNDSSAGNCIHAQHNKVGEVRSSTLYLVANSEESGGWIVWQFAVIFLKCILQVGVFGLLAISTQYNLLSNTLFY